jgi:2-iminobutanoate/2-iminopropanoate deaminase
MPRHAIGDHAGKPYSPGVQAGSFVFVSGQIGLDESGKIVSGGAAAETRQSLENVKQILATAQASLEDVVMVNIYLIDFEGDYAAMNEVYTQYFPGTPPARATVEVRKLALGSRVEVTAIAMLDRVG